jgi:prepilin-type N-terminal cleavage/methylation domain-containing protein
MQRARRRRGEGGMSLVELMVVLVMTSIVSALVYAVLIDSTQVAARADNSVRAENNGRLALRAISQDIRAAVQIRTATSTTACTTGLTYPAGFATCVGFLIPHTTSASAAETTVAGNPTPIACPYSNITYGLKSGVIREDRTDYNASCVATSSFTGKAILGSVTNTSAQAMFTFYDLFGNRLGASSTVAEYQKAGSVTMQIYLNYQKSAPDISLMATAALRNDR